MLLKDVARGVVLHIDLKVISLKPSLSKSCHLGQTETQQDLQNDMFTYCRRSVGTYAQWDQRLSCPHEEGLGFLGSPQSTQSRI